MKVRKTIWDLFEEAKTTQLGHNLFSTIQATLKYIRLSTKAKRAEVLFGEKSGEEYSIKADIQDQKRKNGLKALKKIFSQFYESLGDEREKKLSEQINKGDLYQFTLNVKKMYMLEFLNSNMNIKETKDALKNLDKIVSTTKDFQNTKDVLNYLYQHIDTLLSWKISEDWAYTFCLAMLEFTSLLLVVEISALTVCISLKNQGKSVDCQEIHKLMALYVCGMRDSYLPD